MTKKIARAKPFRHGQVWVGDDSSLLWPFFFSAQQETVFQRTKKRKSSIPFYLCRFIQVSLT